jgi:hypothetical protein
MTLVATVTSQRRRSRRYIGRPMRTMLPTPAATFLVAAIKARVSVAAD